MRVLPQRTIDALGLQVEVRGQPARWSGRVARETTPTRKRRTTRPLVPCRRRHERSDGHALPSPGVCPPGVPLSELGLVPGPGLPGHLLGRKPTGLSARWGARRDPDRGTPIPSETTPAFGAGYGRLSVAWRALATDDEHERRVRLLLLSKGAVLAHWFDRPLAPEMDDKQHWPPTCFEEKQGTSPLLLPLRPRL